MQKKAQAWLKHSKIKFEPQNDNLRNVSQTKSILSRKVYETACKAQNQSQLIRRILEKLTEIEVEIVQCMLAGARAKLRNKEVI